MTKFLLVLFLVLPIARIATAADEVPTDIQMPGTQPLEIGNLESPNKCDNCHGGYNKSVEPAHNWSGSMMAQAGRDPIFWATMAIAEQVLDGSGDLCIRCHSTGGWLAGRSTPTDGSGLAAGDSDGVECDYCHKLTNPDDGEHQGVMNPPFVANDTSEGWYGSGISSMWGGSDKLGPYDDAEARHQFMVSGFHRDPSFCGTCHDVSNPAVGNLAHNNGTLSGAETVTANGKIGGAVDGKAAFNNPPFAYGVVERTFSEHMSTTLWETPVKGFPGSELPPGGAFEAVFNAATANGASGDYENPPGVRTYTCQSCHMRPVRGTGANKRGTPVRNDLPLHDLSGGNYWMASAIQYLDQQDKLRLGGGLTADQVRAMNDVALRAQEQLRLAATLEVEGPDEGTIEVEITNHTGHKLLTGYPEGRRMWLNINWYDEDDNLVREDGEYGKLDIDLPPDERYPEGRQLAVRSIIDLDASKDLIFEAHMGMTRIWADQLFNDLGVSPGLALSYDRLTGVPIDTLGEFSDPDATEVATFHFAINNIVKSDNRIPPFGMRRDIAVQRNATPVPADQYLEGGIYENHAELDIDIPTGAAYATIDLLYQPTSWEYIQFLYLANDGSVPFLAEEGANILDAWLNTGMAEPLVMATANWTSPDTEPPPPACDLPAPELVSAAAEEKRIVLNWLDGDDPDLTSYNLYHDQAGKSQLVAALDCDGECLTYTDSGLDHEQTYCYKVTTEDDTCESDFSNIMCATPLPFGQTTAGANTTFIETGYFERTGKGKNTTEVFNSTDPIPAGERAIIRLLVTDSDSGSYVSGASVNLEISGGTYSTAVTSANSDLNGIAEAVWTTQAPNKKGHGGTPIGSYSISVTDLGSTTHEWDGIPPDPAIIDIQ